MNARITLNLSGFLVLWLAASSGYGDEPAPPPAIGSDAASESTDDALLRSLLGEDSSPELPAEVGEGEMQPAVSPPSEVERNVESDAEQAQSSDAFPAEAVARLRLSLDAAKQKLAAGETGDPTLKAQANVVDELNRLIEAANQQSNSSSQNDSGQNPASTASPQPRPGESSDARQTSGTAGGDSAGSPQRNRDGPAEESSDRVRDTETTLEEIRNRRSALVRDVWGHLPDRLRDQLLNADSDRYLPQYDSLVRQYFESLSRPSAEPGRP